MRYTGAKAEDVRIAYVGGGSRGWAWGLMSDLASAGDMSGTVALYDIDREAAMRNAVIGNRLKSLPECVSAWNYEVADSLGEALTGADFVVISILPGTFDEMESDVHAPERYGIYQSVGDTTGPGGLLRAMRAVPMFVEIAEAIRDYSPNAWVINYTNPMTVLVRTLYKVFPQIKAFGCCHEVFGTQQLLAKIVEEKLGYENVEREDIRVNVLSVNHFTWLTEAKFRNIDLFPVYKEYALEHVQTGSIEQVDENWMNRYFECRDRVKMDLFLKYGYIAAAGDRHLAEFCPGSWYLKDPETAHSWGFTLTPVSWRKEDLANRLARSARLYEGSEHLAIHKTGEEGIRQMRALLGLCEMVTNVNIPNQGQVPNLPLGAVVETNASFCADTVRPVFAGPVPASIYPLIAPVCGNQELITQACLEHSLEKAFRAFTLDQQVNLSLSDARALFDEMVSNTGKYLTMYH